MFILAFFEIFAAFGKKSVKAGEGQNQSYFNVQPGEFETNLRGKVDTEEKAQNHGWKHDVAQQSFFHGLEDFIGLRADCNLSVINEDSWQI